MEPRMTDHGSTTLQKPLVLVTGGTGFIAQHCILALRREGYRVRTTVRTLDRVPEVRTQLLAGGIKGLDDISFVTADLDRDTGWTVAVRGCRFVMHGASPTPSGPQVDEKDWIAPAVEGNLRVLKAARDEEVQRVVLTSAFGAIGMGHGKHKPRPFDETVWSDLSGPVAPYQRSKTLSERAAWEFIATAGGGLELATVNPVAVLGPALGADFSHSIRIIQQMMKGQPCPKINSGFVDVRDVADLHVLAMTRPEAAGERFLAISGRSMWFREVATVLKAGLGEAANRVSTRTLPNWVVRFAALSNPSLRGTLPMLGMNMDATGEKAERLLGWRPRSAEEAIISTAESLLSLGLLDQG
jgi:dihydroflavonol-4-reductase